MATERLPVEKYRRFHTDEPLKADICLWVFIKIAIDAYFRCSLVQTLRETLTGGECFSVHTVVVFIVRTVVRNNRRRSFECHAHRCFGFSIRKIGCLWLKPDRCSSSLFHACFSRRKPQQPNFLETKTRFTSKGQILSRTWGCRTTTASARNR